MYRNGIPSGQLKRVNPFQGLMIDADTWRDAHDYHRLHQQRHGLLLHGWGIVSGLEVRPHDPPDRSLEIGAGVAVDAEGRLMVVAQPTRYHLNAEEPGLIYLLLTFRDIPSEPFGAALEDGKRVPSRLREGFLIAEYDRLPDTPYVELARVRLSAAGRPVVAAPAPARPAEDQLDLRFRVAAGLRPGALVGVGCWQGAADEGTDHATGLAALVQELAGPRWQVEWHEVFAGAAEPIAGDLLALPLEDMNNLPDGDVQRLTAFLDGGGVVLAESCGGRLSQAETTVALAGLARALGRTGAPVAVGHPLLTAAHIFTAPPPGAVAGDVLEADGLVLSGADYACAWKGCAPDRPLGREAIRTAQEWGANLLAYALARRLAQRVVS